MGEIPYKFPGYALNEILHSSSTTVVCRGERLADGASVVFKCAQRGYAAARHHTQTRNEYELLRGLGSDHVVAVHDLVAQEDSLALVLEYVPGYSLKQWLAAGDHSLEQRLVVALDLALAISEVHAASIIHKDINSHNVVYDPAAKRCKLIDFGIATRLRSEESKFQMPAALEGTLAYIAPEQTGRMNRSLDYRADLYSLGVTLYELFSGRLPHDSTDPVETVHFHIAGKAPVLHEITAVVPRVLSDIVMKLLQKAPEQRYQSAAGVAADLARCLEQLRADGRIDTFSIGAKDVIDRFETPQKLYGREPETRTLLETFQRVANGGVETVLVAGQAGIGKTSLVHEIHLPITQRRGYFASGKFDQLNRDVPFSALVAALAELVDQLLTESEDAIVEWRAAIQAAVGGNGRVIVDVVPSLELIIGPQPSVPELDPFEAQNRFNLVFQRFIQVFGKKAHPLVLFLDDLQWADQASLNLVSLILSAPATESLLLVAAYRDNEVTTTHPFMMAVNELRRNGAWVTSIALEPLGSSEMAHLVADALRVDVDKASALAEVIETKTLGNPFFIRQFLETLHVEKLIRFDAQRNAFDYDSEAVESAAITENVAELLAAKLQKLPVPAQAALRLAAAIGTRFDLETLAPILERSLAETSVDLEPALRAGMIVPASRLELLDAESVDSPLVYRCLAFLHDRVQQAAYAAMPERDRRHVHLRIGRVLMAGSDPDRIESQLFEIVNHMNHGVAMIDAEDERRRLAEICIRAGRKARKSTAYALAVRCLRNAVDLLGQGAWVARYEQIYEASSRLAESLCLNADYAEALAAIDEASTHSRPLDRARLETLKIVVYLSMGDMPEALVCGRRAAALFGVDLPTDDAEIDRMLQQAIGSILERTAEIGVERLVDLPPMSDPERVAAMESLTHCLPAAYQTDQRQYALICCKMVLLSLEHGNCPLSARAYGSFAALLASGVGDYAGAYRFAKLGVDLAHRLDDPAVLSGVYFLWAMFASHWNRPVDESIELFRKSVEYGLETGDHQHAAYSAARRISHQQFKGMTLPDLIEETIHTLDLLQRIGDAANVEFLAPRLRLMRWLRGERPKGDSLASDGLGEDGLTAAYEARGNRSFEADWYFQLTTHRYFVGDYEAAHRFACKAGSLIPFSAGFVTRSEHALYHSLAMTALYAAASPRLRTEYDELLDAYESKLEAWASLCPENFAHTKLLVAAERARIGGTTQEAMELYDEAIAAAVRHGFVQIEALAAELASRFWLDRGKADFADVYLDKALTAYEIWGALGRVDDLRRRYRRIAPKAGQSSGTSKVTTRGTEGIDALDLATVLKANQAISAEIVLERLLATLIDIILENAGAESAALILESGDEFLIQGLKVAGHEHAKIMGAEPLNRTVAVSRGIVNYVIRTGEHVVLSDPHQRGRFRNDPYVRNRHPKSVLCAPILHKGKLTGVIYLENNQVSGAFTPDRLEALKVLFGQIAVSIENAMLYARQEEQTRTIEEANTALTKEVAERKRAELELEGYKDHLEDLVALRTQELEKAQGRLVELSRRAGMAEVASGVLHNVGNVMNSVNVGASVARDAVRSLRAEGVGAVCDLLDEHAGRLSEYLSADPTGRKIPVYLRKLGEELGKDKQSILDKIDHVLEHLEHMKKIVAAQQSYARTNGVTEECTLESIAETALAISAPPTGVAIERAYADLPPVLVDRHKILQILVNLLSNSRHALRDQAPAEPRLRIRISRRGTAACIEISDNGIGITPDAMAMVFNHGFTTKPDGHGFGLHNCANAAQQMGGSLTVESDGPGMGATFTLIVPAETADLVAHAPAHAEDAGG